MSETIERVLFNPNNGKIAVGIRLRFMDKYHNDPLANLEGYKIFVEPHDCDAWAIDNQDGCWVVVAEPLLKGIEDCPLWVSGHLTETLISALAFSEERRGMK